MWRVLLLYLLLLTLLSPVSSDDRFQESEIEEIYRLRARLEKAEDQIEQLRAVIRLLRAAHEAENPLSEQEWQDQQRAKEKANKIFFEEVEKGCNSTRAVFKNDLYEGWVLQVPDGGKHSVSFIYKEDADKVKKALEKLGAGENVAFPELLQYFGECP